MEDLFGAPKKCGEPVVVEVRVPGIFGTKKQAKTMPCKKKPGHWGGHDPLVNDQ